MKKTYTACFVMALASLFYYGTLTGSTNGQCTRGKGYTALANNPSNCNAPGCHTGGVVSDTTGPHIGPSGIYDVTFTQGIAAYPTITSDYVNIATSADASGLSYSIYGLDGRNMMSGALPSAATITSIDVHSLSPANYVIRVEDGASHASTFRIIKQ